MIRDRSRSQCGRVVQKTPLGEIRVLFETVNPVPNAAPTDTLPAVRLDRDSLALSMLARGGIAVIWQLNLDAAAACRTGRPFAAASILEIAEAAEEA